MTSNQANLQQAAEAIAAAIGGDFRQVRRRFRHWAGTGLIPATTQTGHGLGTRRRYNEEAVLLGALLAILAQHGIQGDGLITLGSQIEPIFRRRQFATIRRDGTLLEVDFGVDGAVKARLAQPGAARSPAPKWARLTVNIGQLAEQLTDSLQIAR